MSNNNMPLVSIIIPVYNGSNYMREAIDSALAQTYGNIEVIVVNDGSTDGGLTDEIARSYGNKIRYYNKSNGGVSSALNFGISKMQGEYFSWLSHDDVYCCEKITHQMKYASQDRIVMCGRNLIDLNSKEISDIRNKSRFNKFTELNWQHAAIELFLQGGFNGCSLLIHKNAFSKCGMFDEKLRYCQDLLMWLKMFLEQHSLIYIAEEDVFSRVHSKQLTNTGYELFHSDSEYIADMMLEDICKKSTISDNILYYYARYNAIYDNVRVLKKCISIGRKHRIIGLSHVIKLRFLKMYGHIRPVIRKAYYRLFKKLKTR